MNAAHEGRGMENKMVSFGVLSAFLGMILFLNWCYSFCSDDCFYGLMCIDGEWRHLGSIANALSVTMGDPHRPIVHFIVRVFAGCFDKWVFDVCNTLMLGCLVLLIQRVALKTWKINARSQVLTIAMMFFVLCKGESYLWCAGSVNYWVAVWTLGFCLILERLDRGRCSPLQMLLFFVAAVICGGSNETFTPPMCAAMAICMALDIKNLNRQKFLVRVAYAIPAVMMVLYERSTRAEMMVPAFSLQALLVTFLKIGMTVKCVWILAAVFLLSAEKRAFLRRNRFELMVIGFSLLAVMAVGFHGERTLWCANLFAAVVVVREWTPRPCFCGVLSLAVLAVFVRLIPLGLQIKSNFNSFIGQYLRADDCVTAHEHVPCGGFTRWFHQQMYTWQSGAHSYYLARYYGRTNEPIGLPMKLYEGLYKGNTFCSEANRMKLGNGVAAYTAEDLNTIVVPLAENPGVRRDSESVEVTYALPDGFFARVWNEWRASGRPIVHDPGHPVLLETNHGAYFLVAKKHLLMDCAITRLGSGG